MVYSTEHSFKIVFTCSFYEYRLGQTRSLARGLILSVSGEPSRQKRPDHGSFIFALPKRQNYHQMLDISPRDISIFFAILRYS